MNEVIKTAIAVVGSQRKLGKACGLTQAAVQKWLYDKAKVAPENVQAVVNATNGVVKGYQLRPDLPHLFPHPDQVQDSEKQ
ncbi:MULTISPECIES: transcriptional regulator [unclassified Brenneria]|uniref:transcriptional regulator n=1 Tax=unclassified Brenneria TaxID=2634434 RepID=UPI001554C0C2|nr:YdaS family helix-turn-helix protein [Brenneria sp. hezel4-2-4]MEE3649488.1 YdaS family helix-turn-helix protein [Brenneria sp. HEZEL_4_2_4]NPC99445.1 transcriptional regulator [Brenneria sp. hezel4-2-4]